MEKSFLERLWLIGNILFVLNYTPYALRWIMPLPRISNPYFNIFCLSAVYLSRLYSISPMQILQSLDMICILLFISVPLPIFLFPFYMKAIVNLDIHFLRRHKALKSKRFLKFLVLIEKYRDEILCVKSAVEVFNMFLSIILVFVGYANIVTMFSYVLIVRNQYIYNETVKLIFNYMRVNLDTISLDIHPIPRNLYLKVRDVLIFLNSPKTEGLASEKKVI